MTTRLRKLITRLALLGIMILVGSSIPTTISASSKPIIVGSKSFSESKTVSEIYALALEHAGYKVVRKPNISNSVVFRPVKAGQMDVYPEYTRRIVEAYLKKSTNGKSASQVA